MCAGTLASRDGENVPFQYGFQKRLEEAAYCDLMTM